MPQTLSRRAITVWLAAVAVYVLAIAGRTSFGVSGVAAIERFQVDASRLAVFTAVQVGVYAIAQIPTGVLVDKLGPRSMLLYGAILMGLGQIILGFAPAYWVAILARVLIGAGDATAFLSVMRLIPAWFPARKAPLFSQLTGALGQSGQFISAVPFLHLLGVAGWSVAFVSLGAVGILIACAAWYCIADSPEQHGSEAASKSCGPQLSLGARLRTVLRSPTAWQGVFIHWSNLSPINIFLLLWGVPMMKLGMGLDAGQIATVLSTATIGSVCAGPLHGMISARAGNNRDLVALATSAINVGLFAWFFASGQPRNQIWLMVLIFVVALLAPAANYGFDSVREHLKYSVLATGTGLANMGGFVATMIGAQLIGALLDWHAQVATFQWADFRVAWLGIIFVWAVGAAGIVYCGLRLRRIRDNASVR
ncbi:MFS transporter [Corynebacterium gerontici]|uniref:Putative sulfoacetate transporter SauU n=1 Tax=Corynebacterium gerontici TaxID=2079234 RepID=A0A3G6J5V4_9CORY|nr:MFS transporter [Corynebacterium gerontici]AZA11830.1 putative sulfoacetate transporter SauU [Corynebacterium gerontici]